MTAAREGSPDHGGRRDRRGGGGGRDERGHLWSNDSVMHACGGNQDVAKTILQKLEEALESGSLIAPREKCMEYLGPLEDADGEREGKDRGSYRLLKAMTVLLRLKGYNSRDYMMPIKEIDLTGHPLLAFTLPQRGTGVSPGRPEAVVRALELAVHLARASNHVQSVKLGQTDLGPEGGDKCMTEVVRLVRRVGIGAHSRFLDEVDLHGNTMDAEAVKKLVEAAVKERSERPRGVPLKPLWLDLSGNRVRNPQSVFENLQAWAGWAHDCENALCLADQEGCSKEACPRNCMLHMPNFFEQGRPEAAAAAAAAPVPEKVAEQLPAIRPMQPLRVSPPPPRRPAAPDPWRAAASPGRRREARQAQENPPPSFAVTAATGSRRQNSRRRRRREEEKSPRNAPRRMELRPAPGARGRSRSSRGGSGVRKRSRSGAATSREASVSRYNAPSCSASLSPPRGGSNSAATPAAPAGATAAKDSDYEYEYYSYSYTASEGEEEAPVAPPAAAAPAASPPKSRKKSAAARQESEDTAQLEQRINRLFDKVKGSSAVATTSAAPRKERVGRKSGSDKSSSPVRKRARRGEEKAARRKR